MPYSCSSYLLKFNTLFNYVDFPFLCHVIYSVNAFYLQTQYDGRMFNLNITCGDNYPEMPPDVRFVSKIAMNCVDKNGRVSAPPI